MKTTLAERLFRRSTYSLTYMPVVDGIRFVAILMVFIYHFGYIFNSIFPDAKDNLRVWNHIWANGFKGVPVFFMLSGFILSLPFAKQYLQSGNKVSLRSYYLRRFIRLEPPYIIIMSFWCLLQVLEKPEHGMSSLEHLLVSFVYGHNIVYQHFSFINVVAWSLEVEIQFYLLAPLLCKIFLLPTAKRRAILLLSSIFLCGIQFFFKPGFTSLYQYLHFFLLGMLLTDFQLNGWPKIVEKKQAILFFFLAAGIMYLLPVHSHRWATFAFPFFVFLCMMFVLGNPKLTAFFSLKWITLIGGMCYSIYLIHFPLINLLADWLHPAINQRAGLSVLFIYLLVFAIGVLISSALFFLAVEKPFMKLSARRGKTRLNAAEKNN